MARRDAAKIAGLPREDEKVGEFWEEVLKKKDALRLAGQVEPARLASMYEQVREEKAQLEARHKGELRGANVALAALYDLLPEAFDSAGVETVKTKGGHVVSTSPDISTAVTDKDALLEWVHENGYERKLTLYAPTVKSITMERLRAGDEMPSGVDVRGVHKINFRRA